MISNKQHKYLLFIFAFLIVLILGAGIDQYFQKTDADKGINDVPDIEKKPLPTITPFANSIEDSKKDAFSWEWVKTQWAEMPTEYKDLVIVGVGLIGVGVIAVGAKSVSRKIRFWRRRSKLRNVIAEIFPGEAKKAAVISQNLVGLLLGASLPVDLPNQSSTPSLGVNNAPIEQEVEGRSTAQFQI